MGTTDPARDDPQEFFAERRRTLRDPAHEAFCLNLMKPGIDATNAWRIAYGKGKKAQPGKRLQELLSDPAICRRMQFLQEMAAERVTEHVSISEAYVLDGMKDLFERSMQVEQVVDRKGVATGEFKFDSSGAGKSLDMMAKCVGLYREKRQASETEKQTDDKLLENINALSKQLGDVVKLAGESEGVVEEEERPIPPVPEAS